MALHKVGRQKDGLLLRSIRFDNAIAIHRSFASRLLHLDSFAKPLFARFMDRPEPTANGHVMRTLSASPIAFLPPIGLPSRLFPGAPSSRQGTYRPGDPTGSSDGKSRPDIPLATCAACSYDAFLLLQVNNIQNLANQSMIWCLYVCGTCAGQRASMLVSCQTSMAFCQ